MDSGEEGKKKVELIRVAIQELLEEKRKKKGMEEDGDDEEAEEEGSLLTYLLSQLACLEKDADTTHSPKGSPDREEPLTSMCEASDSGTKDVGMDEIMKELRRIRRQNFITHCLLSIMIVVTATWQLSEVSFLLNVKEKLSNPLKSVGDMIKDSLKGRGKKPTVEGSPLPTIGVPELPNTDLPTLTLNGDER